MRLWILLRHKGPREMISVQWLIPIKEKKQFDCLNFAFEHIGFEVMRDEQYSSNINFIAHFNSALLTHSEWESILNSFIALLNFCLGEEHKSCPKLLCYGLFWAVREFILYIFPDSIVFDNIYICLKHHLKQLLLIQQGGYL